MLDLIGGIVALATSATGSPPLASRPVTLVYEQVENGLIVRIIGASSTDSRVRYRLELGGDGNSGNRVNQAGSASLRAGAPPHILASIRMTGSAPRGLLVVEVEGGAQYAVEITPPS
jgi:hypothetical protein